ncbi:hypothetical protein ACFLY4_07020 [Chloroflexota bacterium]
MLEEQSNNKNQISNRILFFGKVTLFSMIGGFYLLGFNLLSNGKQPWLSFLQGLILSLSILAISIGLSFIITNLKNWKIFYLILGIISLLAWILYFSSSFTALGWIVLSLTFGIFIRIDGFMTERMGKIPGFIVHGLLALGVGFGITALVQIENHFAEEEFFSAVQGLVISGYWFLLLLLEILLFRRDSRFTDKRSISTRPLLIGVIGLFLVGLIATILSYQRSFYPLEVPTYSAVNPDIPFICGQIEPVDQIYDGKEVFEEILLSLESNPNKSSPEFGMLALGTREDYWAEQFRSSLLTEARHGKFTEPAGSVKYGQYLAAFRAYYYSKITQQFPDLFNPSEKEELRKWFAAINRRALTVELVDWMYAIAFSKLPDGPYENQETGTGLLALLESQGLADPGESSQNLSYLEQNLSGWMKRFSNTDDAAVYQPEWINNALYQSIFSGNTISENVRLSFEWLLLQALPDGAPLRYNHIGSANFGGLGYLGAYLLGDERFVWLSGRALEYLNENRRPFTAQPGFEERLDMVGRSPDQGSCLLYGDSGLPNQIGPLAPDKIVFRDGWERDSAYLLLNLRFTGWHRYKATNTITLVYEDGVLASDQLTGEKFGWLPEGRSLFRDKRIPRENLNGLLVEKVGLSRVLNELTGLGSPWAQDPPYYAKVEQFSTEEDIDTSTTVIEDWHGWTHERTIIFHHDGPIVVKDDAWGPSDQKAALSWNLVSDAALLEERLLVGSEQNPAEVLFMTPEAGEFQILDILPDKKNVPNVQVQYMSKDKGQLTLFTIFLTKEWVGAQAKLNESADGLILEIWDDDKRVEMPL